MFALAGPAAAEAPFNFNTAPGRLPKTVVPIDYQVAMVPNIAAKTLFGSETIVVEVRRPVTTVVFNSLNERLQGARFDDVPVANVQSDDGKQLTTVTLAQRADVGRHTLTFDYVGKLETAPQGLFVQSYRAPGGATGTMLSTQFEATDAHPRQTPVSPRARRTSVSPRARRTSVSPRARRTSMSS